MISAVEVVRVVEAIRRKPVEYGNVTFFGMNDQWQFIASQSPNMCPECESYDVNVYFGSEIRGLFPYLEIVDENTIYPHVHPNCLCTLVRAFPVEPEELEIE